jgi:hypothetical protein
LEIFREIRHPRDSSLTSPTVGASRKFQKKTQISSKFVAPQREVVKKFFKKTSKELWNTRLKNLNVIDQRTIEFLNEMDAYYGDLLNNIPNSSNAQPDQPEKEMEKKLEELSLREFLENQCKSTGETQAEAAINNAKPFENSKAKNTHVSIRKNRVVYRLVFQLLSFTILFFPLCLYSFIALFKYGNMDGLISQCFLVNHTIMVLSFLAIFQASFMLRIIVDVIIGFAYDDTLRNKINYFCSFVLYQQLLYAQTG